MMQFGNVNSINLDDPDYFEILGGLWKGKKPPFTKAGVIRNTNFTASGEVDYSDVAWLDVEIKQLAKRKLRYGDIIIERSGGGPKQPVGRVVQFKRLDEVFSFSNFTTTVRVKKFDELEPLFAFYVLLYLYLSGRTDDIQRRTTGLRNLDFKAYKERAIFPLITTSEQCRIVHILATVQTAIEQQERLIKLTRELKAVLMHNLFTGGLRGEKQKITEIGLIPESWEVVQFHHGIDIKNGQVDPKESPYKKMIHVGPENIERNTGRLVSLQTNEELHIKSGNYHFTKEDILYSKIRPYLNKVALPYFEGTCSADMYPLKPKDDYFDKGFVFQLLLSETFKKQAISHQDRTGIPKINRNQLGSILLPKPILSEQKEIADSLSIFDSKLAVAEKKQKILEELFRTLLHQLMTGQTRVNDIDLPGFS